MVFLSLKFIQFAIVGSDREVGSNWQDSLTWPVRKLYGRQLNFCKPSTNTCIWYNGAGIISMSESLCCDFDNGMTILMWLARYFPHLVSLLRQYSAITTVKACLVALNPCVHVFECAAYHHLYASAIHVMMHATVLPKSFLHYSRLPRLEE
jgi:hypothetical protein